MKDSKKKISPIKKISLTAMFLSLGVIVSYGSNFIPFFMYNFLTIDLSIIFSLIPINFLGLLSSLFIIISIGFFNLAWSSTGFVGPLILVISNISFTVIYSILNKIIKFKKSVIINIIISILINSIILALLNGIIFAPIFFYLFTDINTISFIQISENYNNGLWYEKLKFFLMFIPNYWAGIFSLYISFNLFKFLIVGVLFIIIEKIMYKNNLKKYMLY